MCRNVYEENFETISRRGSSNMYKKITATISAILLSIALTACSPIYDENSDTSATDISTIGIVQSTSESTPVSSETFDESSAEYVSEPSITIDLNGQDDKLFGTPRSSNMLIEFNYESLYKRIKDNLNADMALTETLNEIGNDEVSETFYRAVSLTNAFVNRNLTEWDIDEPARIETDSGVFHEKGVTYSSFYNELCGVFAEEYIPKMTVYPFFCSYNGGVWLQSIGISKDTSIIHTEYNIVENTSSAVEFDTVHYCIGENDMAADYDETKKNEYVQKTLCNRFVMTEDGWRAVEVAGFFGDRSSLGE